jgi:hypothetical protein
MQRPYLRELEGSQGLLDYFRQCTYDAIAEWKVRNQASTVEPNTIRTQKDALLRLPARMESHSEAPE